MDGTPHQQATPRSRSLRASIGRKPLIASVLLASICLSGCAYDPKRFQLPRAWPRHSAIERRMADFHDPFPDDTLGPESSFRPLGFHRQRTLTRRTSDLRDVFLLNPRDRLPPDSTRAPKNRFANSVRP